MEAVRLNRNIGLAWLLLAMQTAVLFGQQPAASPRVETPGAQSPEKKPAPPAEPADPFADLAEPGNEPAKAKGPVAEPGSWRNEFFQENFGFRKELMFQTDVSEGNWASRQSAGFEIQKKFSTATSTVASFNFQGRLVRRDGYNPVLNDMEGATRPGWFFEYHNFFFDLYNVLNPALSDEARGRQVGRFNVRAGRFYVPFGLNLQTDTHGTVLQLSNDRNFGFERDWYTGFWGSINRHLNYDAYYLVGSGYDLKWKGQSGLGAFRLSLSNKYLSDFGLEGGFSLMGGERLAGAPGSGGHGMGFTNGGMSDRMPTKTTRLGMDGRYRRQGANGLFILTSELSRGRDAAFDVNSQLYQGEYLHSSRKWGLATQYRRFNTHGLGTDASIIGEVSWYFKNDVGNSSLHWLKLNVEKQLQRATQPPATVVTLQYYFYR